MPRANDKQSDEDANQPSLPIEGNISRDSGGSIEKNKKGEALLPLPTKGTISQVTGTKKNRKRRRRKRGKPTLVNKVGSSSNIAGTTLKIPVQNCNRNLNGGPTTKNKKGEDLLSVLIEATISQVTATKKKRKRRGRKKRKRSLKNNVAPSSTIDGTEVKDKPPFQDQVAVVEALKFKPKVAAEQQTSGRKEETYSEYDAIEHVCSLLIQLIPKLESLNEFLDSAAVNRVRTLIATKNNLSSNNAAVKTPKSSISPKTPLENNDTKKTKNKNDKCLEKEITLVSAKIENGDAASDIEGNQVKHNKLNENAKDLEKMDKETPLQTFEYIAIDCEMVEVIANKRALGRVSIVDQKGTVLLDKYIKPDSVISDYLTEFSGIQAEDIENAESFTPVRAEVLQLVKGKIIVGHGLHNDFQALQISLPLCQVRDTSKYIPFLRHGFYGRTPSLKTLCKAVLGLDIQTGKNCTVENARVVMSIYNTVSKKWEASLRV